MEQPNPSALTNHLRTSIPPISSQEEQDHTTHPRYLHHLAHQILHNLQYQHDWINLHIHTHSPLDPKRLLPRPLISGIPPQRIYIHPDEQIEILQREKLKKQQQQSNSKKNLGRNGDDMIKEEEKKAGYIKQREWILPTHLREKWSLKKFAGVFDGIDFPGNGHDSYSHREGENGVGETNGKDGTVDPVGDMEVDGEGDTEVEDGDSRKGEREREGRRKRRDLKRVLLATLGDDSTVVYYIVHDGIVKPRQN